MLRIDDLHKRYGDIVALDGVTFDVPRGAMVGFVGRNGAGKTTTMRVVMGVVRPAQGTVTWDGRAIDEDVRLRFGYMPEERGLYPKMHVRDQLTYFGRLSGLSAEEAARATDRWVERLGVEGRADDVVDELSLGNQQRVQLAAALVHSPDLLVLDEPFSGLDPVGVDVLAEALREEADRGVGVLFSSHQLELIERLCDDVVIIEGGRIVSTDAATGSDGAPTVAATRVRISIEVEGASPGWLDTLPDVTVVADDGTRAVAEVDAADGPERLLDAARAAGRLVAFQVGGRTLGERFRAAVER
jgi:ABC-2 type transport system ATP-binding protein